jgi:raffinose/stachyose/melibiose transport system permease protein
VTADVSEPTSISTATSTSSRRRSRRRLKARISASLLVVVMIIILLPVVLMLSISLRSDADAGAHPLAFPTHPQWHNYVDVFRSMDYLRGVFNTSLITACSAVVVVTTGSLAAWAISRHVRGWTNAVYRLFIAGLTVPIFVLATPLYLLMRQLHLLDSYGSVILGYAALNLPFAVFFYTSFLRSVPIELEEAAAVDGASTFGTFWRIVFPLLRPATATLTIFVSLSIWNDLVLPLLFLSSDSKKTVNLSVFSLIGTEQFHTSQLFPAVVLATLPLFAAFLLLQRHIVSGITAGAGKS